VESAPFLYLAADIENQSKQKNKELAEIRSRKEERAARDYSTIYSPEAVEAARREKERLARAKLQEKQEKQQAAGGDQGEEEEEEEDAESDDSFM
jgi:hypothetical protein